MSNIKFIFIAVNLIILFFSSCGGSDNEVLARGDGIEVTDEDFVNEFNRLMPEDQVEVLNAGGKLNLVTRLIYRDILLSEAEKSGLNGLEDWLQVSEDIWLARQWLDQELESIYEAGLDSNWIDSMKSIDISVSAVLLKDSVSAAVVMDNWNTCGPSEPDIEMATAPWSFEGSSYFDLQGEYFRFFESDPPLADAVIKHEGEGAVMMPFSGVWAVSRIDTLHRDPGEYDIPLSARYYISTRLSEIMDITVLSQAVDELNKYFVFEGNEYSFRPDENFDPDIVVAEYPGGALTAGEVVEIADLIRPENFLGDIPDDFIPYRMPKPMLEQETDLWNYISGISEMKRQAVLAVEEGINWPDEERELTITEHVLRENVLNATPGVDTLTAMGFYNENREMYAIPELRSIVIAYVPSEWLPSGDVNSFDDLDRYYTHADSAGNPLPTDLCTVETFKSYGEAVFAADSGVFTGPVEYAEDNVYVFFKVVDIVREGEDNPALILPVIIEDCRNAMVTQRLADYLLELWNDYSIEVDSALVNSVDPWKSSF